LLIQANWYPVVPNLYAFLVEHKRRYFAYCQ